MLFYVYLGACSFLPGHAPTLKLQSHLICLNDRPAAIHILTVPYYKKKINSFNGQNNL